MRRCSSSPARMLRSSDTAASLRCGGRPGVQQCCSFRFLPQEAAVPHHMKLPMHAAKRRRITYHPPAAHR